MVMDIGLFGTLRKLKLSSASLRMDDDFVDRLNHYYTGVIIIVFTIIVSAKQYVGQPLQCWVPGIFTRAMEQYAENYCWVQNTYWVPMKSEIPTDTDEREDRKIGYYQWVPFVLVCEAFMFYMPCVIWRLMNWQSGVNLQGIVRMACDAQNVNPENRLKTIKTLGRHVEDALDTQRVSRRTGCAHKITDFFSCGKRVGNYLTILYLLVKLLYIGNVIGQFFLLNKFLGTKYTWYGIDILLDLINGREWQESGRFPRVTMCDFVIRVLGNKHRYSIQCVLMINLFNEKIFIFLWFWFLFVASVTGLSFFFWLGRVILPRQRNHFVKKYLKIAGSPQTGERKLFHSFIDNYLRQDGVFVLRMVALNAGDVIATDVINQIWQDYREKKSQLVGSTLDDARPGQHRQGLLPNGENPQDYV